MTDRRYLDVVKAELNQLDSLCQQFHDAHNLYYDELATPEEREIASRYFNDKESNIFKYWILQCEARISDNLERLSDKRSAKSRSSRSSKVDFISSHLSSISHLTVLNHPQNMQAVVQKLPYALQTKWRENVVKTRRKDGKVAGVAELVEFSEYAASKEQQRVPIYPSSLKSIVSSTAWIPSPSPRLHTGPGPQTKTSTYEDDPCAKSHMTWKIVMPRRKRPWNKGSPSYRRKRSVKLVTSRIISRRTAQKREHVRNAKGHTPLYSV